MNGKRRIEPLKTRRINIIELKVDDWILLPCPICLVDCETLEKFAPPLKNGLKSRNRKRLPESPRAGNEKKAGIYARDKPMHIHSLIHINALSVSQRRKIRSICRYRFHLLDIITNTRLRRKGKTLLACHLIGAALTPRRLS